MAENDPVQNEKTVEEILKEDLQRPASVANREGSVSYRSIEEQIKADQYLSGKQAAGMGAPFGIRMARTVHTGEYG